jgi:hypothetical protein
MAAVLLDEGSQPEPMNNQPTARITQANDTHPSSPARKSPD